MINSGKQNTVTARDDWDHLLDLGLKLRALAYLIENQRADADPPTDLQDINWGLGALLTELSKTACELARNGQRMETDGSTGEPPRPLVSIDK